MNVKEYVRPYPHTLSPAAIHAGDHSALIPGAQDWSYAFGQRLHEDLSGVPTEPMDHPVENLDYWRWSKGLQEMELNLMAGSDESREARHHALNELNFHIMNVCMRGMWTPFKSGGWQSQGDRLHRIGTAERALAAQGFLYFAARSACDTADIFEAGLKLYQTMAGKEQEFDSVLVLLGAARRNPNWTIVPAPLNFERTRKRTNVDFVVADMAAERAVGIQVKTNVRDHDFQQADKERVVFIDGTVDLNNVKAVRTRRKSSNMTPVAWPGIICAKTVDAMQSKKHGMNIHPHLKHLARQLVGDMKVDYSGTVDKIEERILEKL